MQYFAVDHNLVMSLLTKLKNNLDMGPQCMQNTAEEEHDQCTVVADWDMSRSDEQTAGSV